MWNFQSDAEIHSQRPNVIRLVTNVAATDNQLNQESDAYHSLPISSIHTHTHTVVENAQRHLKNVIK